MDKARCILREDRYFCHANHCEFTSSSTYRNFMKKQRNRHLRRLGAKSITQEMDEML